MESDQDEEVLVIASLFHDIGKLRVRHDYKKKHPEHGYDMLGETLSSNINIGKLKRAQDLVKLHHSSNFNDIKNKDDVELLKILKECDCLSAAHEREDRDKDPVQNEMYLEKILSYTSFKVPYEEIVEHSKFYVTSEELFLKDQKSSLGYNLLEKNLVSNLKQLDPGNFKKYINAANSILRDYTSFVPSAFYYSKPTIPLYDHSKITASLALCKYRSMKRFQNNKFDLIRVDISGIQNYIFRYFKGESADERGTRRLRGRSLRISLTTRAIAQYIVDKLDLYDINIIWIKSDGALIISPHNEENENIIKNIALDVEKELRLTERGFQCFIGSVTEEYDIIPRVESERVEHEEEMEIHDSKFRELLLRLNDVIGELKKKPQLNSLMKAPEEVFNVLDDPKQREICDFCGLLPAEGKNKCKQCLIEEEIGRRIVNMSDPLILNSERSDSLNFAFGNSQYSYHFEDGNEAMEGKRIYINEYPQKEKRNEEWEVMNIGNYAQTYKGAIVSINDMLERNKDKKTSGETSNEDDKYYYLGVMKADVDNMGIAISDGLRNLTMTSYAVYSRQIALFFSSEVNRLAEKNGLYVIYSGGDDLSILGNVIDVIDFAKELRDEFGKWILKGDLTFSAGISVVKAKFPIRRAIEIAESNLKKSKDNYDSKPAKNSITIFDTTMTWSNFASLADLEKRLENIVSGNNPNLGRGFLHYLLELDEFNPYRKEIKANREIRFPDHYLNYYLKRNWKGDFAEGERLLDDLTRVETFGKIRFPATVASLNIRWSD